MKEVVQTLQPADPVGNVASIRKGNARKWLIWTWGTDAGKGAFKVVAGLKLISVKDYKLLVDCKTINNRHNAVTI